MKFYCLYNSKANDSLNIEERISLLDKACKNNEIKFCLIDEINTNFSNLPTLTNKDGLYNCARGSYLLERNLINNQVRTFYKEYNFLSINDDSNILCFELAKQGIQIPKTIFIGTNNKSLLKDYVDYLGWFPIVLKTYSGTSGIGVIKVNNFETLNSIADYFINKGIDFQFKEFINSNSCERLIVLGNEVITGVCKPNKENDFRSGSINNYSKVYSDEINELAIKATHSSNFNFAGVDIIIDENTGKPYVLEVNMPLNFVMSQKITGIDIGDKIIKWLFREI